MVGIVSFVSLGTLLGTLHCFVPFPQLGVLFLTAYMKLRVPLAPTPDQVFRDVDSFLGFSNVG